MEEIILEAKSVEKVFPDSFHLTPTNMTLKTGEVAGFIGKNGAGKTTFLDLITGNSDTTSGSVELLGEKLTPDKYLLKRRLGYMPQSLFLPKWVSGIEILKYAASLYNLDNPKERIATAMEYWDCEFYKTRPLAACSHGMQKRVALALATLHDPELLILDEPFSGLDIFHIKALDNEILRRSSDGKTTIVSTHIVPFTVKLCSSIYIMKEGQLSQIEDWKQTPAEQRVDVIEKQFFG